jgi:hypothetical protein
MKKYKDRKDNELGNRTQKRYRKPYVKPNLIEYGHIEKLTHGPTAGPGDGASGKRQR